MVTLLPSTATLPRLRVLLSRFAITVYSTFLLARLSPRTNLTTPLPPFFAVIVPFAYSSKPPSGRVTLTTGLSIATPLRVAVNVTLALSLPYSSSIVVLPFTVSSYVVFLTTIVISLVATTSPSTLAFTVIVTVVSALTAASTVVIALSAIARMSL